MRLLTIIFLMFIIASCSKLPIQEVSSLEKRPFDPIRLSPGFEANNLRIDLIRQSYQQLTIDSSYYETVNIANNPLGFDLGNGLFFDLNDNLCLRLDQLMNFSPEQNFTLRQIDRPKKDKGVTTYTLDNNSLEIKGIGRRKNHILYRRSDFNDSIAFMGKKQFLYSIVTKKDTIQLRNSRRLLYEINPNDETSYSVLRRKRTIEYHQAGNRLFLGKNYAMEQTPDNYRLNVLNLRKNRIIYTIEQSDNRIWVYDRHYFGKMIELGPAALSVYHNKKLIARYELIK